MIQPVSTQLVRNATTFSGNKPYVECVQSDRAFRGKFRIALCRALIRERRAKSSAGPNLT
jgi:hypothetical protein